MFEVKFKDHSYFWICGGQSYKERYESLRNLEEKNGKILLVTKIAGGVGLNLQKGEIFLK